MTVLRDLMDAETAAFERQAHIREQWYETVMGLMLGNKPWAWAKLPGLGTAPGCLWERQALPKSAMCWRADITSIRIDGGRFGFQCYVLEWFRARVEEGKLP